MALEGEMVDAASTAAERRMIMVKCKYEGTGIWNGRCTGTKEVDPCPGYDKCKQYKPNYTTNADRIRSMSDYELAQMLAVGKGTFDCFKCRKFIDGECSMKCYEQCLEWLQKPAKGE